MNVNTKEQQVVCQYVMYVKTLQNLKKEVILMNNNELQSEEEYTKKTNKKSNVQLSNNTGNM